MRRRREERRREEEGTLTPATAWPPVKARGPAGGWPRTSCLTSATGAQKIGKGGTAHTTQILGPAWAWPESVRWTAVDVSRGMQPRTTDIRPISRGACLSKGEAALSCTAVPRCPREQKNWRARTRDARRARLPRRPLEQPLQQLPQTKGHADNG